MFLTPSCFVHKIDKIHYKDDEIDGRLIRNQRTLAIESQKQEAKQEEYKVLSRLNNTVSGSYLK